ATQMGNQGTSYNPLRTAAAVIKGGACGTVKEVHVWTNRPVWPQGKGRPTDTPATPSSIHWDLFIGPAPKRPYNPVYHPFKWHDCNKKVDPALLKGKELQASGCLVIGDKDSLYAPGDYAEKTIDLLSGKELPKVEIVRSPGHFKEWVRAIKGGEPATSNFPN